jgi:hypothetical protein
MAETGWTEEQSEAYAAYMETNVKHDHRRWARAIRADWPGFPGGGTIVDLAADGPLPGRIALYLWIRATAPRVIKDMFWKTMQRGVTAGDLAARMKAAGFADARVLSSGVSYLARGDR